MVEVQQDNLELVVVPVVQVVEQQEDPQPRTLAMEQQEQPIPEVVAEAVDHLLQQETVELVVQEL